MIATTTTGQNAMRAVERQLAYSAARSDIECLALRVNGPFEHPALFNVDHLEPSAVFGQAIDETMQTITRAVEYLDWIGALERQPGMPHLVTIRALP